MAPRRQSKRLSSRASDVSSASNSKKQQQQHEEEDRENHSQSTGVSARATRARVMLEEFDKEVSTRCSQMQAEADMIEKKLRSSLEVELLKLPERVRSMPMSELLAKYDGNLSLAISSTPRRSSIRASAAAAALNRDAGADGYVRTTPLRAITKPPHGTSLTTAAKSTTTATTSSKSRQQDAIARLAAIQARLDALRA